MLQKNKLTLYIVSILFLLISITSVSAFSGSGSGTESDPYQITNCSELNETRNNLTASYELVNDIDCSDTKNWNYNCSGNEVYCGWKPIGGNTNEFNGVFNGDNHIISNLTINRNTEDYNGLFGKSNSESQIKNIGVKDVNISAGDRTGSLVGQNYGSISEAFSIGNVNGKYYVGGLIGIDSGSINNSYSNNSVDGTNY